jgi:hypothetical protein
VGEACRPAFGISASLRVDLSIVDKFVGPALARSVYLLGN